MENNHIAKDFIKHLCCRALASSAVNHPYLDAFRNGEFADMNFAIRDFAYNYGLYSIHFVRYLTAVINHLSSNKHKKILQSNLAEESGAHHDAGLPADVLASIERQSHIQLYNRFQNAVGADVTPVRSDSATTSDLQWSQQF